MSKRLRDESSSSISIDSAKVEAEGKSEKKLRTTADAEEKDGTAETSTAAAISKRINQFLNELSGYDRRDNLAPILKDLASARCVRNKWSPPVSSKGLEQLEHFLCTTYPMKKQLKLLQHRGAIGIDYDRFYNGLPDTSEVAEVGILKIILEEATQLLLSEDKSLVACFLGFIQWNNEAGAPQSRSDIPDYEFFMAVMAHARKRLPVEMMQQMLRSMVHEESNSYDLEELSESLALHFKEEYDGADDDDEEAEESNPKSKTKIYKQLDSILENEVEVMGINIDGDDDESEGEGDSEGDEVELG